MFSFYAPELEGLGTDQILKTPLPFTLNKEESHHAIQVLRLEKGSRIQILNGKGYLIESEIVKADSKACQVNILSYTKEQNKPYSFHLVIAPTKNLDRLEWLLEKATEMGIDQISPVVCQNSERRILNTERLRKVIVSAVKQSGQLFMPRLNELVSLKDFLKWNPFPNPMVAHCRNSSRISFLEAVQNATEKEFTILIGPEGDFTEPEVEEFIKMNFIPISLGKNRLRTETAALMVCAQLALLKA